MKGLKLIAYAIKSLGDYLIWNLAKASQLTSLFLQKSTRGTLIVMCGQDFCFV